MPTGHPVLGWAGAPPVRAPRIGAPRLRADDLLDPQVQTPGREEVVLVAELLALTQPEVGEANLPGVGAEARPVGIDAILGAADDEPVQVLAAPAEEGLHDGVQPGHRGVGRHSSLRQISGLIPAITIRGR